jgi:hypothetical protein
MPDMEAAKEDHHVPKLQCWEKTIKSRSLLMYVCVFIGV